MSLFAELKRRNVFRVGVAYVAASWLLIQVADVLFPEFRIGISVRLFATILAIGLLPALLAAWAFELTPEGIKRDRHVDRKTGSDRRTDKRLDRAIIAVLVLAVVVLLLDKFVIQDVESDLDRSIAVMPFEDLSPDGDQAWFSDGMTEEVLHDLEKLPGLKVISRSSAFALRDENLTAPESGQKLNATYLLEGSVRRIDDEVRITTQLIEAAADKQLWSETYDRKLGDVLAIQQDISKEVARQLRLRLITTASAESRFDSVTYDLYLKGLYALGQRTDDSSNRAIDLFEQVIRLTPEFAPAHANLAIALIFSTGGSGTAQRVEAAANEALRFDPDNSLALSALGLLRLGDQFIEEGRSLLERAIETNPNNPLAYRWLGTSYTVTDASRYYALARQAQLVDPLDPTVLMHVATAATRLGRYEEARGYAQQSYQRGRKAMAYGLAADSFAREGLLDKALLAHFHTFRTDASFPRNIFIPVTLMSLGELDLAQAWIDHFEKTGWPAENVFYARSAIAYLRDEPEEALRIVIDARAGSDEIDTTRLAWAYMRFARDFETGLDLVEGHLTLPGLNPPRFEPEAEATFTRYALALARTGRTAESMALVDEIQAFVEGQVETGAISGTFENWQLVLARLHMLKGDTPAAISALQLAQRQGGLARIQVLQIEPYADLIRDDPAFVQILADQEAGNRAMRDALQRQGMLLSPEQVLQLRSVPFNPFPE